MLFYVVAIKESANYNVGGGSALLEIRKKEVRRLPSSVTIGSIYPVLCIHRHEKNLLYPEIDQGTDFLIPDDNGQLIWVDSGLFMFAESNNTD